MQNLWDSVSFIIIIISFFFSSPKLRTTCSRLCLIVCVCVFLLMLWNPHFISSQECLYTHWSIAVVVMCVRDFMCVHIPASCSSLYFIFPGMMDLCCAGIRFRKYVYALWEVVVYFYVAFDYPISFPGFQLCSGSGPCPCPCVCVCCWTMGLWFILEETLQPERLCDTMIFGTNFMLWRP